MSIRQQIQQPSQMNAAAQLNARQRHYDNLHHMQTLQFLRSAECDWPPSDVFRLVCLHEKALKEFIDHGMSTGAANLKDANAIADLEAFAESQPADLRGAA